MTTEHKRLHSTAREEAILSVSGNFRKQNSSNGRSDNAFSGYLEGFRKNSATVATTEHFKRTSLPEFSGNSRHYQREVSNNQSESQCQNFRKLAEKEQNCFRKSGELIVPREASAVIMLANQVSDGNIENIQKAYQMQKNAMISVKEAASLLELDERTIRERLINGSLRGEKRNIGQRDKWYVYAPAIEAEVRQKRNAQNTAEMLNNISQAPADVMNFSPELQQPIPQPARYQPSVNSQGPYQSQPASFGATAQEPVMQTNVKMESGSVGVFNAHVHLPQHQSVSQNGVHESGSTDNNEIVDAVLAAEDSGDLRSWLNKEREAIRALAEEMVKPIAEQLQRKDRELQDASFRLGYLEGRMIDQEEQIKLLPDYQARAEEAERLKALEVEALRKQIADLEQKKATALEQERRAAESSEQAWKQQIAALKEKQASAIEQERRAVEAANIEVERLKSEKEAEAKAIQEQLSALTAQLQELKQPKLSWWQKWFAPGPE